MRKWSEYRTFWIMSPTPLSLVDVMNVMISDCTSTHHTLFLETETVSETLSNKVLFTW